jgi:thiol-disulfide isomerase/thioredoxin
MKNFTIVISLLTLLSFISGNSVAGDRMVLVERFTSSTCPPCASNNPIMDAFLASQDPERIVGISYHMNWPAPGNDPMFLYNPNDNTLRRNYYSVNSIPQAKMDGFINVDPPYTLSGLQSFFDSRKDSLSPVTIIVTETPYGDSVLVRALIYCESPVSNPNVTVHFAVVEKHIHYQFPPGTNGETDFYDVMRKMLPTGNGTSIALLPGQTYILENRYRMDTLWQASQIRPLVFIQGAGREILNSALKPINFTLMSNPAYKVVLQGQNQSAAYKIKVPFVAQGYNSPVTLTAQVLPPASGVTTSFPSGNVISNFPDSVTLQVNSTSAVPTNSYRIVVTGTNAGSKTHKTVVNYLVGRSYIFVGSNRGNLQFKVDNVTYISKRFFEWDLNSTHNLAAVSPQVSGSTRYVFQSWSDGGDTVHNINITPSVSNYTVNYKIQFKLLTNLQPPGIPANITGSNIFYDSAATAFLSISPLELTYNGKTWYFQRWQGTGNGSYTGNNPSPQLIMNNVILESAIYDTIPIGVHGQSSELPKVYELFQNYPNPFNPVTKIEYALPKDGEVTLVIYDVLGNEVLTLYKGYRRAGYYEADFDATNLASGIYFYRIASGSFTDVKKMLLIK